MIRAVSLQLEEETTAALGQTRTAPTASCCFFYLSASSDQQVVKLVGSTYPRSQGCLKRPGMASVIVMCNPTATKCPPQQQTENDIDRAKAVFSST